MSAPEPDRLRPSRLSRWAMTSRALWGGAIAFVVAAVIVGGMLAGSAIATRRSAQAAEVAVATYQAAAVEPAPARPTGPATPTPELVTLPGQTGAPRPGVVGVVLDVTGNEITVKTRQGPTGRVIVQPSTVIRKHGQRIPLADLKPSDRLVAVGKPNQQQRTLQAAIVVVDAPRPFPAAR